MGEEEVRDELDFIAMPFLDLGERTYEQTVERLRAAAQSNLDDGVWTMITLPSSRLLEILERASR